LKCGYPERFAQQALGHNSKAVHHAYPKHAEVTVPSLDDWEKQRVSRTTDRNAEVEVVQVDFKAQEEAVSQGATECLAVAGRV
jgi:hypothetical protein